MLILYMYPFVNIFLSLPFSCMLSLLLFPNYYFTSFYTFFSALHPVFFLTTHFLLSLPSLSNRLPSLSPHIFFPSVPSLPSLVWFTIWPVQPKGTVDLLWLLLFFLFYFLNSVCMGTSSPNMEGAYKLDTLVGWLNVMFFVKECNFGNQTKSERYKYSFPWTIAYVFCGLVNNSVYTPALLSEFAYINLTHMDQAESP